MNRVFGVLKPRGRISYIEHKHYIPAPGGVGRRDRHAETKEPPTNF